MVVVVGFVVGVLVVRLVVNTCRSQLRAPVLQRENHRGRAVPTASGLFAVGAILLVEAGRATFAAFGVGPTPSLHGVRAMIVFACVGYALLGFVDDVLGDPYDHGFRGHVGALGRGRVTTGAIKVIGGGALALVLVSSALAPTSGLRLVADAALVALAANLANLFDRAPGRTLKVALVAWIPLAVVAGTDPVGAAIAPVIGAFTGLLGDDVRESMMLGDTGAYPLGAALGLAVVLECSTAVRTIVLCVLVLLTVAAEFVSFGRVIDRVPGLRELDRLGRGRAGRSPKLS